jgi:hypothetical protein
MTQKKEGIKFDFYTFFLKTYSLIYSALTAIPDTPVQNVSDTTDIRNFTFRRLGDFFIDISPVDIFKLIILNTIANRSKLIATVTGIDGAAVTLVSAQYTNHLTIISISQMFRKVNIRGMGLYNLIIHPSTNLLC